MKQHCRNLRLNSMQPRSECFLTKDSLSPQYLFCSFPVKRAVPWLDSHTGYFQLVILWFGYVPPKIHIQKLSIQSVLLLERMEPLEGSTSERKWGYSSLSKLLLRPCRFLFPPGGHKKRHIAVCHAPAMVVFLHSDHSWWNLPAFFGNFQYCKVKLPFLLKSLFSPGLS